MLFERLMVARLLDGSRREGVRGVGLAVLEWRQQQIEVVEVSQTGTSRLWLPAPSLKVEIYRLGVHRAYTSLISQHYPPRSSVRPCFPSRSPKHMLPRIRSSMQLGNYHPVVEGQFLLTIDQHEAGTKACCGT